MNSVATCLGKKASVVLVGLMVLASCGHQPNTIQSSGNIDRTPASEYMVSVIDLPLQDYPKLQKFKDLQHLQVSGEKTPLTDRHVGALAQLEFPRLRQVSFALCGGVTDAGIRSLTHLPSIEGLLLRGTSLTDRGMFILATAFPNLKAINVEDCRLLTRAGFLELSRSRTITSVGMSVDPFSQRQLEEMIGRVPNVTWWILDDPHHRLDHERLRRLGDLKGITIQAVDENRWVKNITTARQTGAADEAKPAGRPFTSDR